MSYHCYYLFSKLKILSLPNRFARVLWQLKKIYLLNGGFDINFNNADPEDIDLGYRLINKGLKIP